MQYSTLLNKCRCLAASINLISWEWFRVDVTQLCRRSLYDFCVSSSSWSSLQQTATQHTYTYIHKWTYNVQHSPAKLESETWAVTRWGRL